MNLKPFDVFCLLQTLAAFCAQSLSISIGFTQGYSAILLPQLQDDKSEQFKDLTDDELSWIGKILSELWS